MQAEPNSGIFSYAAIALGAAALLIALIHTFAGPFAPQQSVGVMIGEIAGEIRGAAQRALAGEPQPAPQVAPWDIDRILRALVPIAGVSGLLLALAGILRSEPRVATVFACALCAGALAVQLVIWVALLIAGALIIVAILHNMDAIFG